MRVSSTRKGGASPFFGTEYVSHPDDGSRGQEIVALCDRVIEWKPMSASWMTTKSSLLLLSRSFTRIEDDRVVRPC